MKRVLDSSLVWILLEPVLSYEHVYFLSMTYFLSKLIESVNLNFKIGDLL